MSEALDIALVLDSTTDNDRQVLGVYFAGRNETKTFGHYLMEWLKQRGHNAETQVSIVKAVLKEINDTSLSKKKIKNERKKGKKKKTNKLYGLCLKTFFF